jgi:hypothetical protein
MAQNEVDQLRAALARYVDLFRKASDPGVMEALWEQIQMIKEKLRKSEHPGEEGHCGSVAPGGDHRRK